MESMERLPETKEGIRQWYNRTTRTWRKALLWSTVIAIIGAAIFFCLGSMPIFTKLQTFNGAMVIPIGAGLWMAAFVFIFLIPSREAGFRSQEWIEVAVAILQRTVRDEITPAAKIWTRIGTRVEEEIPKLLSEIRNGIDMAKATSAKVEEAIKKNETIAADAKPVIEALKRIEDRLEKEIKAGLIDDIRQAAHAVKSFAGADTAKKVPTADQPNLGRALQVLERKR